MTKKEEAAYLTGQETAYHKILGDCIRELEPSPERELAVYVKERHAAIRALRDLCEAYGDNNWPDHLHLADIIEKHLGRHLDAKENKR